MTVMGKGGGGPPLTYPTVAKLQVAIDEYFAACDTGREETIITKQGEEKKVTRKIPYTVCGLALAVGLDRGQLIRYAGKPEFVHAIKKAKAMIENDYEISLRTRGTAGDIFGLKNFGWTDQSKMELTGANGTPLVPIDTITTEERAILRGIAQDYAAKLISGD